MTKDEMLEVVNDAAVFYGFNHQMLKLIEEIGELSREAVKILLEETDFGIDHFFEEWADVMILLDQMRMFLPASDDRVKYWYEKKIARLSCRMAEEKAEYDT